MDGWLVGMTALALFVLPGILLTIGAFTDD
jgi:hypothetical protein